MKKLLTLILAFGIVNCANAALMLSVNGSTTVEQVEMEACTTAIIDVWSTNSSPYGCWLGIVDEHGNDSNGGEWTGNYVIYYDKAGFYASVNDKELPNWWLAEVIGVPGHAPLPGKHFDFEYHCLGPDDGLVYIQLWNFNFNTVLDTVVIHQVPEPATLLLLGIGGLAVLRKRRT